MPFQFSSPHPASSQPSSISGKPLSSINSRISFLYQHRHHVCAAPVRRPRPAWGLDCRRGLSVACRHPPRSVAVGNGTNTQNGSHSPSRLRRPPDLPAVDIDHRRESGRLGPAGSGPSGLRRQRYSKRYAFLNRLNAPGGRGESLRPSRFTRGITFG